MVWSEARYELTATYSVTIANGASLSSAIDLQDYIPVRIDLPAAWTAANLTIQVSNDNSTYVNLYKSGVEYQISGVSTSRGMAIPLQDGVHMGRYIKVRSGTSGTAVNQGADRTLTIYAVKMQHGR